MAYTKQGFKDNNILYANQLIAMEDGIIGAENAIPTISENPNNSDTSYQLDFVTKNGTITTPNLKGDPGENVISVVTNADVYSENEQMIGYYTDGKPLYRKTYSKLDYKPSVTSGGTIFTIDSSFSTNNYNIVKTYGYYKNIASGVCHPFPYYGTNISLKLEHSSAGLKLNTLTNTVITINIVFCIEYTKTTDTAINPSGFGPSDYSTDEIVIGKWIDGKPLYRKVYSQIKKTGNIQTVIDSSITPETHSLVRCDGIMKLSSGTITSLCYSPVTTKESVTLNCIPNTGLVVIYDSTNLYISQVTVIIEYTKITD